MSLDNVLAVAGAAHGNLAALTIGLIVSIVLMAFASTGIAKLLDKYPQIQWLGLVVILFVAVEMILSGSVEVEKNLLHVNIFPFVAFLVGGIFLILQQKYLKPVDKERMKSWITERLPLVLIFSLIFVVITIHFGDIITGYLQAHSVLRWVLSFGLFLAILESISLLKSERIAKK
jgi:Integral membrane protein TerC family